MRRREDDGDDVEETPLPESRARIRRRRDTPPGTSWSSASCTTTATGTVDSFVVGLDRAGASRVRIMKNDLPPARPGATSSLMDARPSGSASMLHLAATDPRMRDACPPSRTASRRSGASARSSSAPERREPPPGSPWLPPAGVDVLRRRRSPVQPPSASVDQLDRHTHRPPSVHRSYEPVGRDAGLRDPPNVRQHGLLVRRSLDPCLLIPLDLQAALPMSDADVDWPHRTDLLQAVTGVGKLFGALATPALSPWSRTRRGPGRLTSATTNFIHLARQHNPKVLVIMAYFLAFANFLPTGLDLRRRRPRRHGEAGGWWSLAGRCVSPCRSVPSSLIIRQS